MFKFFKNINSLLTVLLIITFIGIITTDSVLGQTNQQNCLKIKGKIINGYTAEIAAFQYSDNTSKWVMIYSKKNKTNYSLVLNPQLNYQIFFLSNNGQVKVLHIDAGDKGMWEKEVDVDFDKAYIKHAKIYQAHKKNDYSIVMVSNDYVNQNQMIRRVE